jgi:hypothetical protein
VGIRDAHHTLRVIFAAGIAFEPKGNASNRFMGRLCGMKVCKTNKATDSAALFVDVAQN